MTNRIIPLPHFLILILFLFSCAQKEELAKPDSFPVDPFIGSGGHGHVFVGANVPFGAIQLGPSNIYKGWDWCSGYHISDSILIGFAHTHLSGTGIADLGDILIMPVTGKVKIDRGQQDDISNGYAVKFCHCDEEVSPGFYALNIREYGVKAELTATERVGMHRYTFSCTDTAHILIDLKEGNGDQATDTYLKQIDNNTIEGYRFSRGWARNQKIWFSIKSSQKITMLDLFNDNTPVEGSELKGPAVKGVISFPKNLTKLILKVGISPVSCENARANIEAEIPGWNFDKVTANAENKWNQELSKIEVETSDPSARKKFYTSLYHSCFAPVLFNDADGSYRGTDKKEYPDPGFQNYSIFSLWDTYRTENQLLTLTQPERINDIINSMLKIYEQQGKLPVWHLLGNETNTMPGYSAVPVVVDAFLKGFSGFNKNLALEAVTTSATLPAQIGVPYILGRGYIPCDSVHEATSKAMEYAVDDACIALMAKEMGEQDIYKTFSERADYYKTYFDKNINFIRPKMADGSWRTPYDPIRSVHTVGDFTEGNGWQYTFFAPQDPGGLIELFGGDDAFTVKLDSFFLVQGDMGEHASADITGLIGMYAHGNEPSHHIAYLYAFAGQQWKTAKKVRYILDEFYTTNVDGLIGNEDCGQMSAWFVMSSLGFYPVHPANGIYVFGSPLMDKATINLPEGKKFTVESINNSKENIYIQSVKLNGQEYYNSYITYSDIAKGGTLTFKMGAAPNFDFGSKQENRPHSEL